MKCFILYLLYIFGLYFITKRFFSTKSNGIQKHLLRMPIKPNDSNKCPTVDHSNVLLFSEMTVHLFYFK